MICAKTEMDKIPQNCMECNKRIELASVDGIYCNIADVRYTHMLGRPDWCPLVTIDETLPAQLEKAISRVDNLKRLLEESDT